MKHFPQHLLAKIVIFFSKAWKASTYEEVIIYRTKKMFGVSLGRYIIINEHDGAIVIKHEYGHSLQAEKLGWLYLPIVGLSSITMNILTRLGMLQIDGYYERWPESWADTLGGVIRDGR